MLFPDTGDLYAYRGKKNPNLIGPKTRITDYSHSQEQPTIYA